MKFPHLQVRGFNLFTVFLEHMLCKVFSDNVLLKQLWEEEKKKFLGFKIPEFIRNFLGITEINIGFAGPWGRFNVEILMLLGAGKSSLKNTILSIINGTFTLVAPVGTSTTSLTREVSFSR